MAMEKVSTLLLYYSCYLACHCHLPQLFYHRAHGFSIPKVITLPGTTPISKSFSTTSLRSSRLPPNWTKIPYFATITTTSSSSSSSIRIPSSTSETIHSIGERNGLDSDYPWRFEGRFMFRPSLVRITDNAQPPQQSSTLLSIFGYSLGGTVVLEYDISPVGPYREYVTMGGLVGFGHVNVGNDDTSTEDERTLGIGQWGANLYVSTQVAEDVCHDVWGVPAQLANIEFVESGSTLDDYEPSSSVDGSGEGMGQFCLGGWGNTRLLNQNATAIKRYGNLLIYWTPTIKALWAPLLFPGRGVSDESVQRLKHLLPLHKLRLSASAIRLKRCRRLMSTNQAREVPFGFALVVDGVLIEIGERIASSR